MTRTVAFVPARMEASRFPGKPLADIMGLPMIEHVRRRALLCPDMDDVVVATCDQEIVDTVTGFGGRAVMTARTHERCTDRIAEAIATDDAEIAVIVQGDEPLLAPEALTALVRPFQKDANVLCSNLLSVISDPKDLDDVDIVKAEVTERGRVLTFSRAPIPYLRVGSSRPMYRQTGLSAFSREFLHKFSELEPTALEIAESVDFLRIVGHEHPIEAVLFEARTQGVDRPQDVAIVENIIRTDPVQAELFNRIQEMN